MRPAVRLSVIALLTLIPFSAPGQSADGRFVVGVLQENGTIIPFARYDGSRWLNTWPGPVQEFETPKIPTSLTQTPREWLGQDPPQTWRLWLPGGTSHAIRTTGLTYAKSACGNNWALSTDFPKVLNTREATCPLRAIGIVLSTDKKLIPFFPGDQSSLGLGSLEKAGEAAEIRQMREWNEAAGKLGAQREPSLGPNWEVASRGRFPVRVERAWFAETDAGDGFYYVEANRRFDNLESSRGCARFSAFRGWIAQAPPKPQSGRLLKVDVELTDCDFKEIEFITPMGLLELAGGNFAIVQIGGWESQSYGILKVGPAEVSTVVDSPVR